MYPVIVRLGPLTVYSFGVMMATAFLVAGYLGGREMKRKGLPPEHASNMVFWAAVGGLAGSRLWSMLEDWQHLSRDPLGALFSGSGFVWYGGLLGGAVAVSWVIWRQGLPWLRVVDCVAPALVLAHGIGRIGCQLAGDGDWGTASTLPWAMAYPNAIIGWEEWLAKEGLPLGTRVHPTPIYELLAYTAIFAVLWSIRKRPLPDGTVFWWYLILAPAARFLIEFVRHNEPVLAGLSEAQVFSLFLIGIGAVQLWIGRTAPVAAPAARRSARR